MAAGSPDISVVIVSFNTRDVTLESLRQLHRAMGEFTFDVWVVDNASSDGSVEAIRQEFPNVRLTANGENRGFGVANNQAMEQAQGQLLLLINSDAYPHPGAIASLVGFLKTHPEAAAVGPRLIKSSGAVQLSVFPFPNPFTPWLKVKPLDRVFARWIEPESESPPGEKIYSTRWVSGACLLVRRSVYEQIGGFDPGFFFYYEETDWQKRMVERGWRIGFDGNAPVLHLGGGSKDRTPEGRIRFGLYAYDGIDRFVFRHYGVPGRLVYRLAILLSSLVRILVSLPELPGILAGKSRDRYQLKFHFYLFLRQVTRW